MDQSSNPSLFKSPVTGALLPVYINSSPSCASALATQLSVSGESHSMPLCSGIFPYYFPLLSLSVMGRRVNARSVAVNFLLTYRHFRVVNDPRMAHIVLVEDLESPEARRLCSLYAPNPSDGSYSKPGE